MKNYYSIKAINFSSLKHLLTSDDAYLHSINTVFEPTPAMVFGSAVHEKLSDIVNNTHNFEKEYCEINDYDFFSKDELNKRGFKNTKAYKETINSIVLGRKKVEQLNFLQNVVSDNFIKDVIKDAIAESEYFIKIAKDKYSDILKCKPDVINHSKKIILDWKTTSDFTTERNMFKSINKYAYWLQASFYQYVVYLDTKKEYDFYLVFINSKEPHDFNYIKINGFNYLHITKALISRALELRAGADVLKNTNTEYELTFNPIENKSINI